MNRGTRRARAASFGSVAEAYERSRPAYPPDAAAWLAGELPRDVIDLGAGTGKLTRLLVAAGHRVIAVEPLAEMRDQLEHAVADGEVIDGTAEAIPLPGESADVVTVAQAFHWFDQPVALAEIARVLRRGGTLGLVWNTRDEAEPWVTELSDAATGREGVETYEVEEAVAESGRFGPVERTTFAFAQRLDLATLLDLVLSRSYCAVLTPAERQPVLDRVKGIFADHAQDGAIELPYVTECFRAVRL